ncbi:MAG: hypothetical protein ACI4CS_02355, partial [Candidatus Weimeria sp.]
YDSISRKRHSFKERLLKVPGFRSRTPWKSAVAMVFYLSVISLAIETDTDYLPGVWPVIARVYEVFMIYFLVYCGFNYRDLKFCRAFTRHHSRLVTVIGICLMEVIFAFIFIIIAVLVEFLLK